MHERGEIQELNFSVLTIFSAGFHIVVLILKGIIITSEK